MKKLLLSLLVLVMASPAFAVPNGVRITDLDVNAATTDGSMTFVLDVGDSFTYRLLNDGAGSDGLDVIVDLGRITAGANGVAANAACSEVDLIGLTPLASLGQNSVPATCFGEVAGLVKYINLQIPLRATLNKAGAGGVNVSYTSSNVTFQGFVLKDTRDLTLAGLSVGTDRINAGAATMVDGDQVDMDMEIKAQVAGPGTLASYNGVLEVDVVP